MPRITASEQFRRHQKLRAVYLDEPLAYGLLPLAGQRDVHRFYQPHVTHSPESLREHQKQLTAGDPSLANRAGKWFGQFPASLLAQDARAKERAAAGPQPKRTRQSSRGRNVSVRGVLRPEPDVEKLAKALLRLAEHLANEAKEADDASISD